MPGIDASIPLGAKAPDQMQQLSGLLNVAKGAQALQIGNQTLQQNQQATQQGAMDLQERQGMQQVMADPSNYTAADGSFDPVKAQASIMRAAPTTGTKYWQALADAHQKSIAANQALNTLTTENRQHIGSVLAALPPDATPELVGKTVDALRGQYKGIGPAADALLLGYQGAMKQGGPQGAASFIQQASRGVLPQETQQTMNTPSMVTLDNGQQTVGVNVKPGVQNIAQGGAVPGTAVQKLIPVGSQQALGTDAMNNPFVVQRDKFGNITGTGPVPGATNSGQPTQGGPFALPPNETPETHKDLQGQRSAAQSAAVAAPVMHDLNRTIVSEVNKGLNTGSLGALTQKVASATGYNLGNESSTDYNVLGKMLERSALTAAQSMGPHTNAGLEAAVKANGSLEYTPQALKKIAYLNDALVTGSELYQHGLEKAIASSPNGVFAKRQFDQQWGQAATPQALRLKNAVDTGNQEEIGSIVKEVGGKGTKGAQQLHQQLRKLIELAGQ